MVRSIIHSLPVDVHIADEHGVEGVQVPAEHSKLIQDEQLRLLGVSFAVRLQQLLLCHNLRFGVRSTVNDGASKEVLSTGNVE